MGVQIDPEKDVVTLNTGRIAPKTTVIINKPRGIASSRIKSEGPTIYDKFPQFNHLDIVGRLDKASEGLLMLSNDGVVAKAVTGEAHRIEKEYVVGVREEIIPGRLKSLERGVVLGDGPTLPCSIDQRDKQSFTIILREGRNHQIRRMCEYLHLTVTDLRRVRIGPIALGRLTTGQHRTLTQEEVASLKAVQ